jgi:hypothetical protein
MVKPTIIISKHIAPCGINCATCYAYQREKNKCPGCRFKDDCKQISVLGCRIKNCEHLKGHRFCFQCDIFPCTRLKNLDKRYVTKYRMSMLENQEMIKKMGIIEFVKNEKERWKCPKCGSLTCVHKFECENCGHKF